MRAIRPLGLGLYLTFCLILYVPPHGAESGGSADHADAANDLDGLNPEGGDAVSDSHPWSTRFAFGAESPVGTEQRMPCLTGEQLAQHPLVLKELDEMWKYSGHDKEKESERREAGGWICVDRWKKVSFVRQDPSYWKPRSLQKHGEPPLNNITYTRRSIIGVYHVHPNPTRKGYYPGPTDKDLELVDNHLVPGLIKTDRGVIPYYPSNGAKKGVWDRGERSCR